MRLIGLQVLGTSGSTQGTALLAAAAAAAAADPRASDVQLAQAPSQVCLNAPAVPALAPRPSQVNTEHTCVLVLPCAHTDHGMMHHLVSGWDASEWCIAASQCNLQDQASMACNPTGQSLDC